MRQLFARFGREDEGQDLIEYALLCALLGVACITGILQLSYVREFFFNAGNALKNAI